MDSISYARHAGISIMPTYLEAIKKRQELLASLTASKAIDPQENMFQGSVSTFDAETSVIVRFLSNKRQLEEMLPAGKNLAIDEPPVVTVCAVYQGGLKWLAGRPYNLVLVILPVVHNGKSGKTYGGFLPVVWENMTEPIMMGRELLGWPKIYAELPPLRWLRNTFQSLATWYGFTFLEINLTGLHVPNEEELKRLQETNARAQSSAGLIAHKFILKTGGSLEPDVDYLTIATNEGVPSPVIREILLGKAQIRFNAGTWEQLSTLAHIVEKLAELAIKEVYDGVVITQTGGGMGITRILE